MVMSTKPDVDAFDQVAIILWLSSHYLKHLAPAGRLSATALLCKSAVTITTSRSKSGTTARSVVSSPIKGEAGGENVILENERFLREAVSNTGVLSADVEGP